LNLQQEGLIMSSHDNKHWRSFWSLCMTSIVVLSHA